MICGVSMPKGAIEETCKCGLGVSQNDSFQESGEANVLYLVVSEEENSGRMSVATKEARLVIDQNATVPLPVLKYHLAIP
jgi:hypothetical protein